jgi:hypothetical protein
MRSLTHEHHNKLKMTVFTDYARSMRRVRQERHRDKQSSNQKLGIDQFMFLLSRDAKEKDREEHLGQEDLHRNTHHPHSHSLWRGRMQARAQRGEERWRTVSKREQRQRARSRKQRRRNHPKHSARNAAPGFRGIGCITCGFDDDGCVCCVPGAPLVTDDGVEGDEVAVSGKCRMPEREQFQSSCHYLFKRGCLVVEGTKEIP